mgnify:CR=1 FL=1
MKYSANYQNGGFAQFEWEGDPSDPEQMDDLLQAAYDAAPAGLCHQCAGNFDISEDIEVYEIRETESRTVVFSEPTWDDRIRESALNATKLNAELVAKLATVEKQRNALAAVLRDAGFKVDVDTFAVSR